MTFLAGSRLVLLTAPLALLTAYAVLQRRRTRVASRFTEPELLPSVAPQRPSWHRHVGAGLLLLSITALAVGFAKPALATRTPVRQGTVLLTMDTSDSIGSTDVSPTRLEAAKSQARTFVRKLPAGIKVAVVQFAANASVVAAPTADRDVTMSAINSLHTSTGTATGAGIQLAIDSIKALPTAAGAKRPPAVIVLLSDGRPTRPRPRAAAVAAATAAAKAASDANIPVDTIAFGTAGASNPAQAQPTAGQTVSK